MNILIGEIIGTMLLILLGNGVVAGVLLNKSKSQNSGWVVVATGWGMAVFVGAFASVAVGGHGHISHAVTIGLALAGRAPWGDVPTYILGQFIGAFIGAVLVWLHYLPHWAVTEDQGLKLAAHSTGPAIRNAGANLLSEVIGTFVLMFGVLTIAGAAFDLGALNALPVALLVWVIGLSLGGPTGYAINPARDLGPRIAHAVLPIAGKGSSDWGYSWIPVAGPVIGAAVAAFLFLLLGLPS